jgi:hypothetical protein
MRFGPERTGVSRSVADCAWAGGRRKAVAIPVRAGTVVRVDEARPDIL